jgi:hypothetical protein
MNARHLIEGTSFGPDALKAIGQAFDEAWTQIAANFGNDPAEIEAARLRLAKAVLSVADDNSRDWKPASKPHCKGWRWTTARFEAQTTYARPCASKVPSCTRLACRLRLLQPINQGRSSLIVSGSLASSSSPPS